MHRFHLLAASLVCTFACGDDVSDSKSKPTEDEQPTPPQATTGPEPVETTGPAPEDPFATSGWDVEDDTGESMPPTPPPESGPFRGPCRVTWKDGAVVRFKWTVDGGTVRVDADGDGESDVCGKWKGAGPRAEKIWIDDGCDKKVDATLEPKAVEGLNLATAVWKRGKDEQALTLVAIPSFTGVDPGFPLHAAKGDVTLDSKDGLVRRAVVEHPSAGPKLAIDLTYDAKGRIKTLKEDAGIDKSIDNRFDYTWDKDGNVKKITATLGKKGPDQRKVSARVDYSCWKK